MHANRSRRSGSRELEVEYTGRPVSGWGGLVSVVRFLDRMGVRSWLKSALPDGRRSPNQVPVMAANAKTVVHGWLRSGKTSSSRGVRHFLAEVLTRSTVRVRAVRADSGFFETALLDDLESRGLESAIAVRMNPLVKRAVPRVSQWRPFGPGLEAGEVPYQSDKWPRPRRLVLVREEIRGRPKARGRRLFDYPDYTYHGVITSMSGPPEEVWRFSNGRADSENRIF